jgi:hypothetical protein
MDGSAGVLNQAVNDAAHVHTRKGLNQQVPYASRSFSGHEDQHSLAWPDNSGHAVMKKIDSPLQVFLREVEPFRPRLPGLQGDDSRHITLGDTEELEGLIAKVIGRGKGQGKKTI